MDVLPRDIIFTILSHIGAADLVKFKGASRWCAAIAREYEQSPMYCRFSDESMFSDIAISETYSTDHADKSFSRCYNKRAIKCAEHGHVRCFATSARMQEFTQYHDIFAAAVDSRYMPTLAAVIEHRLHVSCFDIDYIIMKDMLWLVGRIMQRGKTTVNTQDVIHSAVHRHARVYSDDVLFGIISSQSSLSNSNLLIVPLSLVCERRLDLLERVIAVHPIRIHDEQKLNILYAARTISGGEMMRAYTLLGAPCVYSPLPIFGLITHMHYDVAKLLLRNTPAARVICDIEMHCNNKDDTIDFLVSLYGRGEMMRAVTQVLHVGCAVRLVSAHGVKLSDLEAMALEQSKWWITAPGGHGQSRVAMGADDMRGEMVDDKYAGLRAATMIDVFVQNVAAHMDK